MRFGAARVSAKRSVLHFHNIHFNLCFGGGTQFGSGEDSLFLMECARKGLKIYSYPVTIAKLIHRESTWFKGYTDKFFYDKGVLFSQLFPQMCRPCALFHCFKYRKKYGAYGWRKAYSQMLNGISFTKKKL